MFFPSNPQIDELKKSITELNQHINELSSLENEIESAQSDMDELKKRISEINSEIASLEKERKQSAKEIASIKKRTQEKSIKQIRDEINLTEKEVGKTKEDIQRLIDEDFKNFIYQMNDENTTEEYLWSDTATTPIMDEFDNDKEKDFLVLNNVIRKGYKNFGLVITKSHPVTRAKVAAPTMTELKTYNSKPGTPERMKPLLEEISKYDLNEAEIGQKIPFDMPLPLGGQTYANQTGYGDEWDWTGGYGIHYEGTKYGEVTTFLIIGLVCKGY